MVYVYIPSVNDSLEAVSYRVPGDGFNRKIRIETSNAANDLERTSYRQLMNANEYDARVTVVGIDDAGDSPGTPVILTIPSHKSVTLTSDDLEVGELEGVEGQLDSGTGKWRLVMSFDHPLCAMHWNKPLESTETDEMREKSLNR